ncbi:MAG: ATP-binding cassette domain-containing protein [Butyricicoccus sp.]|nr:ATP-binding cassette domain-containing protein [Butyricicoccus sp.]
MKKEILYVENLTTDLPSARNIDHISFSLDVGEILCITGLQQSGIVALADALSGNIRPSAGTIYLDGEPISLFSRLHANELGIYEIKSGLSIIPTLSISENLNVLRNFSWKNFLIDKNLNLENTRAVFAHYGISVDPDTLASHLSVGQQFELTICRALLCGARVLVCREVGEGFSTEEALEVQRFLHQLRREGFPIILLNSDPRKTMHIADRVIVLRSGMICYERAAAECSANEIFRCITPEATDTEAHNRIPPQDPCVMFHRLGSTDPRGNWEVSAKLYPGIVSGLLWKTGIRGYVIYSSFVGGIPVKGSVTENGKSIPFPIWQRKNRKNIRCLGVRFWESDLQENLTVAENLCLRTYSRFRSRGGILNLRMLRTALLDFAAEHGLDPAYLNRYPRHLPPELRNQIVLWSILFAPPKYLILDCPMYTMDEQIRRHFLNCLSELRHTDTAILWSSNNESAIRKYCDLFIVIEEHP